MKTLYLECNMGAAGDMLMASLSELLPNPESFVDELMSLGFPHIEVSRKYASSCGIYGAHMEVFIRREDERSIDISYQEESCDSHEYKREHKHHHHTSIKNIQRIITNLPISDKVKSDVLSVYQLIAKTESLVHGCTIEEIHFHEVGALDALTDITGVCILMEKINAEKIISSPINLGSGMVHCAHGVLPVPTPAAAAILQGVPCYGSSIKGELCTPTGAALLKHFVSEFGPMPTMSTNKIGIGLGTKEFPAANILRAFLGETNTLEKTVDELSCNLDDCTGEELGFALDILMENGALDVFMTAIQMKKSRPGILLTVISKPKDTEKLTEIMLRHTTTLGVRRKTCVRTSLNRSIEIRNTPFGPVRVKFSKGYEISHSKAEYDDVAKIAREQGLSIREVLKEL